MSDELRLPGAAYADLCVTASGRVLIAAENPARDAIQVWDWSRQTVIQVIPGGFSGDRVFGLYPRICTSTADPYAVAFQCGNYPCLYSPSHARKIEWTEDGELFGTEPVALAWDGWSYLVAYVAARPHTDPRIVLRYIDPESGDTLRRMESPTDTTQGISRLLPDGSLITVDNDRHWPSAPGLSRPCRAGDLIIGEDDHQARALAFVGLDRTRAVLVFDGLAFQPRIVNLDRDAVPSPNYVAIACHNGVRVRELAPPWDYLDLAPAPPPPVPPVPPVPPKPPTPPTPPKPPKPEEQTMNAYDEAQVVAFQTDDVQAQYAEAGQALDLSNVVWCARMEHDAATGLGYSSSRKKHRAELRAALGLPADPQ